MPEAPIIAIACQPRLAAFKSAVSKPSLKRSTPTAEGCVLRRSTLATLQARKAVDVRSSHEKGYLAARQSSAARNAALAIVAAAPHLKAEQKKKMMSPLTRRSSAAHQRSCCTRIARSACSRIESLRQPYRRDEGVGNLPQGLGVKNSKRVPAGPG